MDLFLAAGIDAEHGAHAGGPSRSRRGRRLPLFNPKTVEAALARLRKLSPEQLAAAARYAATARNPKFRQQNETAVRNRFFGEILGAFLGYHQYDPSQPYTLAFERPIRSGKVDVALGRFGGPGTEQLVAPFEMKGPGTVDLDAIPPGRGRSPVQQAWDYAIDAPGSRWVLVSNCVEVRLYAFGRGRDAYEVFDLRKLDDERECERLWAVLSADRLLGGATDGLLRETDSAHEAISSELYAQYRGLRQRLVGFLVDAAEGPRLAPLRAIEVAQTLLDRILFIAFSERNQLLPDRLLERAATARNEFLPQPVWQNFLALFRHVDKGEDGLAITGYNGGLFAADPVADAVVLPDPLAADMAALGRWDYRSDVPVTILGHIFEQSVTDIERMRAESVGRPAPAISRRKRQGIVYTPDVVTRFLVERTVGVTLAERFAGLLGIHALSASLPQNGDPIAWREATSELAFWRAYLDVLRDLTIVDPACGSGAFLVAAFDLLAREYHRVLDKLAALGEPVDFDPMDEIVSRNLHGVDLSAESVEITRLSLWLKTARQHHRLQNLEATIKVGDSLIEEAAFTERPFAWRAAFPGVFERGGFDVVIGNPPYVRMELIKAIKPYLAEHYVVADDRTDLYAYFFERGVRILRDGGRLGFISSSTFFRTGSGEKLRTFLGDGIAVETVVDFGDLQLFEGVTTYPAIVALRKAAGVEAGDLAFLKMDRDLPDDLGAAFKAAARPMVRARLTSASWRFEDEGLARLRDKIAAGRKTLGEVFAPPMRGIVTGFNNAFVIDSETRDRLVAADQRSEELLKPFLRGENIRRWRVESEGLFLINTPKGKVDIEDYPAVRDWLLPFKAELEKRATRQAWFELQQAQLAYQSKFATSKIIYGHFARERMFAFDREGFFSNDKSYFVPGGTADLLSLLNSSLTWLFLTGISPAVRGGWHELRVQYVEKLPIPVMAETARLRLVALGGSSISLSSDCFEVESAVRHRILDLATSGHHKLSTKLHDWWTLDFAAFQAEVKRQFHHEISVGERDQWERYLAENSARVKALTTQIEDAEREIDQIVYRLFDLTADDIRLLEDSLAP